MSQDSRLWTFVSLRPEISGLTIPSIDFLVQLIHHRYETFTTAEISPQVRDSP
jgi:hypothetical protein